MENDAGKDFLGKTALIFIIILAIVIRVWGINHNLPYVYHVDEDRFAQFSIRYFSGDLNPRFFHVPSLYTYAIAGIWGGYYLVGKILGEFHSLSEFQNLFMGDKTVFFILGRMLTLLLSVGTILIVYLLGKRLFNQRVGLIASLFLIFSPVHNKLSHYLLPDAPMVFFQMLSFFFIWMIYKRGESKHYILAGLFAGLAMATKYGGLLLFLPLVIAHIFYVLENKKPIINIFINIKPILSGVFFLAGFFIGCPYAILDFRGFWSGFTWQSRHLFSGGHFGTSTAQPTWLFYVKHGFKESIGKYSQFLLFGGILYGIFRHRKREILLLSYPLVQLFIIWNWKTYAVRYFVPLIPFFALISAHFLDTVLSKIGFYMAKLDSNLNFFIKKRGILASLIVVFFLLNPGWKVINFNYSLTQKDTRTLAKEWIEKNIPPSSRIAVESYCPPVSRKKYKVIYRHALGRVTLEWLLQRKRKFVIISDIMYARFTRFPREFPLQAKFYNSLEEKAVLIKSFKPKWDEYLIDLHNPTIKIYRLSNLSNSSFPGNFTHYSQEITLTRLKEEGWFLQSEVTGQGMIKGNEKVRNPYVRIVDSKGNQIAELKIHDGQIESWESFTYSNSIEFSSLPAQSKVYIGYEYSFYPSPLMSKLESLFKKEYCLTENIESQSLLKKKLHLHFLYSSIPSRFEHHYYQIVTLSKLKAYWTLFSEVFGSDFGWGNDYILNPFVEVLDSEGKEISEMVVFRGKVGRRDDKIKRWAKKSRIIPLLPDDFQVYVGYDRYSDAEYLNREEGPKKFKIFPYFQEK